jgi:hypothetical protein
VIQSTLHIAAASVKPVFPYLPMTKRPAECFRTRRVESRSSIDHPGCSVPWGPKAMSCATPQLSFETFSAAGPF